MSASTVDFITDVDKGVRFLDGAFENFKPFFVTQDTLPGSKALLMLMGLPLQSMVINIFSLC